MLANEFKSKNSTLNMVKKELILVCLKVISVETTLILVLCCLIDIVATIIHVPWQTCKLLVKINLITRQLENPL